MSYSSSSRFPAAQSCIYINLIASSFWFCPWNLCQIQVPLVVSRRFIFCWLFKYCLPALPYCIQILHLRSIGEHKIYVFNNLIFSRKVRSVHGRFTTNEHIFLYWQLLLINTVCNFKSNLGFESLTFKLKLNGKKINFISILAWGNG